jgi:dihydrofolate reductase
VIIEASIALAHRHRHGGRLPSCSPFGSPSTSPWTGATTIEWASRTKICVEQLKRQPGRGLFVAGVKLAQALTEMGLIDEYEFVVHPRIAGHGPWLFAGLSKVVDLKLVSRTEFGQGLVEMRYERRR